MFAWWRRGANAHRRLILIGLHASLDPPESTSQTSSGSVQPFLRSSRHGVPIHVLYNGPSITQTACWSIQWFLRAHNRDRLTGHASPSVTIGRINVSSTAIHAYTRLTASCYRTTWVGWQQKGKTILNFNEARDNGVIGVAVASAKRYAPDRQPCQHVITRFFTGRMLFLTCNQQCRSTEGKTRHCGLI